MTAIDMYGYNVSFDRDDIDVVAEHFGMGIVIEAAWKAAENAVQQGHQWDECPKLVYSGHEFDVFMDEAVDEAVVDCYLVFHECRGCVSVNRSCKDGTYEELAEGWMKPDEWESLNQEGCRRVMREIFGGTRW